MPPLSPSPVARPVPLARRTPTPRARVRARRVAVLGVAALAAAWAGRTAAAQAPLALVNDSTQVASVGFRFTDTRTLDPAQLDLQVATKAPTGLCERGLFAKLLSWLPLCGDPGVYPLLPVELQRDVVRLERYYRRNGFPYPQVDYEVALDTAKNAADVTFTIFEGEPLLIGALSFVGPDTPDAASALAPGLRAEWGGFVERTDVGPGDRLDDFALVALQGEVLRWLRNRGYAFARVSADTLGRRRTPEGALVADARVKLDPGPQARYDAIAVVGVEHVRDRVVLRELPFTTGERFAQAELTEGQQQIFGLNLFQLAAVDVAPVQPRDSTVDIRVTVTEAPMRTVGGRAGFFSESGATGEVEWTHRNFLGEARTFTATLQAWTGVGAFPADGYADTRYRAGVSLRQPYLFNRRFSAVAAPFVESRSDEIERSRQLGLDLTVLYEAGPLRTSALTYALSQRFVDEQANGGLVDPGGILQDSADVVALRRGELRLTSTYGRGVDNALNPRRGLILRPLFAVAGLAPTSVRYAAASLSATALLPFGPRSGVVARVGGGTLHPFGGTDPDVFFEDYLGVRDVLFYAGGTADVRGWAGNQLGPKFFDVRLDRARLDSIFTGTAPIPDPDTFYTEVAFVRRSYLPIGGHRRVFGSLQVNLPLPLGPNWGASAFVDAGRVWAPADFIYTLFDTLATSIFPNVAEVNERFRASGQALRIGTGAGIQYLTPVGFLSLAVGVKVNPSYFDLRAPEDVWREVNIYQQLLGYGADPPDLDDVPARWSRRFQIHLSIGQRF